MNDHALLTDGPGAISALRPALFDMLRSVTRGLASTENLETVLQSITTTLVEHAGARISRIHLLLHDHECDFCRERIAAGLQTASDERALHRVATGGIPDDPTKHHRITLDSNLPAAYLVRGRVPVLVEDWRLDTTADRDEEMVRAWQALGIIGLAGYPLEYRGELLGCIGYIADHHIARDEFELLGIFADQAAMAIKSAQLFQEVERARERLLVENAYLQEELVQEGGFEGIVGDSPALRAVLRRVRQVAPVETTVLLTGETGTGKELIARALHAGSPRKNRPMIKVNCGAIPQGVVESELFGHEKGAFTGALQRRIGRFELAHQGTLFMDEVGELPLDTQVKLLRVLQEGEFERVGSTKPQATDVRLIAATNRNLEHEVANGRFRADLFYRLDVFPIRIPPLRERRSDIPLLVRHFLAHFQRKLAKPLKDMSPRSMTQLEQYTWPGNIRELQNVLERACVLATNPIVDLADQFPAPGRRAFATPSAETESAAEMLTLEQNERNHIRRALAAAGGKIHGPDGAAAMLAINPNTLRSRMQKLGIDKRG